ncbi:hypothetical protein MKW92_024102 [Papaver armeniacum]|nr:hypothetical protein MKW92_024102 [Papaver armeniacum]
MHTIQNRKLICVTYIFYYRAAQKKLKDKMAEFQENISREYREDVERRVFTVTGSRADEQTIDQLIVTGDSDQILQKLMDTLTEIQERHGAVRDVERKLLELQQIFMDMAVLCCGPCSIWNCCSSESKEARTEFSKMDSIERPRESK